MQISNWINIYKIAVDKIVVGHWQWVIGTLDKRLKHLDNF